MAVILHKLFQRFIRLFLRFRCRGAHDDCCVACGACDKVETRAEDEETEMTISSLLAREKDAILNAVSFSAQGSETTRDTTLSEMRLYFQNRNRRFVHQIKLTRSR